jgi:hypothetical protein
VSHVSLKLCATLPQASCLISSLSFVLLKLKSSPEL